MPKRKPEKPKKRDDHGSTETVIGHTRRPRSRDIPRRPALTRPEPLARRPQRPLREPARRKHRRTGERDPDVWTFEDSDRRAARQNALYEAWRIAESPVHPSVRRAIAANANDLRRNVLYALQVHEGMLPEQRWGVDPGGTAINYAPLTRPAPQPRHPGPRPREQTVNGFQNGIFWGDGRKKRKGRKRRY